MVGVPHSKGCKNCRRRKKGCDLMRPECGACLQLGVQCQYEEKRWKFVDERSSLDLPRDGLSLWKSSRSASPVVLQWSLSKTAYDLQIDEEFWTLYLPQSHALVNASDGIICSEVNSALQHLATQDPMVRLALSAFALVCLARVKNDLDLEQQATASYVRALCSVNSALQQSATAQTDATLLACKALGSYEMFRSDRSIRIGTQASDWKRHVAGSSRLIELRGSEALVEVRAIELFDNVRMTSWISALLWRGRYGLEGQSTRILPRFLRSRTFLDRFLDIVEKVPPLLHRLDRLELETMQYAEPYSLRKMYFVLVRVGEDLRSWERDAIASCKKDQVLASSDFDGISNTLGSVFQVRDYCWKALIIYYWSACLVVHTTLDTAYAVLTSLHSGGSPDELIRPGWLDQFSAAALISYHLPSLFSPEAGLWGSQNGALPLALCIHFVAATTGAKSKEWTHLADLIRRKTVGGGIKDFMRSLANDTAPPGFTGDPSVKEDAEKLGSLWFWGWVTKPGMVSNSALWKSLASSSS